VPTRPASSRSSTEGGSCPPPAPGEATARATAARPVRPAPARDTPRRYEHPAQPSVTRTCQGAGEVRPPRAGILSPEKITVKGAAASASLAPQGQTLDGVLHRQDLGTYQEDGRSGGSAEVGLVLAVERYPAGLAILAPWL
jgi:nucleoid-associated protein YgaU